jgi:hypothetical protein
LCATTPDETASVAILINFFPSVRVSLKVTNSIGVSEVSAWRPGLGTCPVFHADPSTFISLAVLLGNDIANKMAIVVPNKKIGEIDYLF